MNDLDRLLSQSLPAVPDAGFSGRVMRRVRWEQARREWKAILAAVLFAVLLVVVVPLRSIGIALGGSLPLAAGLQAVSLAAWLVVASLITARQLSRL